MKEDIIKSGEDKLWLEWLAEVMSNRPKGNVYLDSERGIEVAALCLDIERNDFKWHRGDVDTFWIDVQMFTKYGFTDDEVRFAMRMQPGIENYFKYAKERNAYAKMMREKNKLETDEYERYAFRESSGNAPDRQNDRKPTASRYSYRPSALHEGAR